MTTRSVRSDGAVAIAIVQVALFVLWLTTGWRLEAGEVGGEPATVLAAARNAAADGDYAGLVSSIAPSERPLVALAVEALIHVLIEHELAESAAEGDRAGEARARYERLHRDHGVALGPDTEFPTLPEIYARLPHLPQRAAEAYPRGLDFVAYLPRLLALQARLLSGIAGFEEGPATWVVFLEGELEGLTIDGDTARGTAGGHEVTFVREDGRWYLTAATALGAG